MSELHAGSGTAAHARLRRLVPWLGGIFIAGVVALAAYDIVRSYRASVLATGSDLDTQARVIAEQAARSLQAVDVVLRHVGEKYRDGSLQALDAEALHAFLKEQSVGLVQSSGLVVFDVDGKVRATSFSQPDDLPPISIAYHPVFRALRDSRDIGLFIGATTQSRLDRLWIVPIARRLETARGEFAGTVGGRGRVDYFQDFYRDIRLSPGTTVTLMHRDGTLLARHPPIESALGKHYPSFAPLIQSYLGQRPVPTRKVSAVDGVERFITVQEVPDYPLAVVVTRDIDTALAPWRAQALGAAARTAALGLLAAVLMALLQRQLSRLDAARAELEVSRERYALAVAGSNDGIIDWDLVSDRMYVSARTLQIVGLPPDTRVDTRAQWQAMLALHPDDRQRHDNELSEYLAGRSALRDGEYRLRHPDGTYRWVRVRNLCVRDAQGRPLRLAGSVSDIDAYKRVEAALRESEERYQLAVAGSNEGLWDWDLGSDLLFLSPRAQEFMGFAPGEPRRPRREWLGVANYHPEDAPAVRTALSQHLHGRTQHFVVEYRMQHQSGEWRWYRQRGLALRDAAQRPYRMAGSMEDITATKAADAERTRLEVKLRQAQKLEAMGTLAGGIAHDFNNILSAILGYGEMAQRDSAAGTSLRRHVDAALAAALRAKALVERILAFSRSGMGERVPVRVESVVAETLDLLAASLPPGVRLQRRLASGDAAVMGDPTQIHQVVMNLCTNALQAMPSGGVLELALERVDMPAMRLATSALDQGSYLRLRVSDTGCGIPAEVLDRIFDPFFTTKGVGAGTGLGLSLVHGIVTDLGGGIDVSSQPGSGTTFTVFLPWRGMVEAPRFIATAVPLGGGETILLVDDEEMLVRLGEEMLAELGYEPVGFTSSAAALESFRATPDRFHAVLSDEAMPGMTGSELVRAIRAIRADIPIVLMSGFVSPALSARAREAGVAEILAKPLMARDIATSLALVLRQTAPQADGAT